MSFSSEVKEYLLRLPEKRECCRASLIRGIYTGCGEDDGTDLRFSFSSEPCAVIFSEMIAQIMPVFPSVLGSVVTVAGSQEHDFFIEQMHPDSFLTSVAGEDPHAGDRFSGRGCEKCREFYIRGVFIGCARVTDPAKSYHLELLPKSDRIGELSKLLTDSGLPPKHTVRRSHDVLYYKSSTMVEDFLTFIGAGKYALGFMETKVINQLRGDVNRVANCEIANIDKAATAAAVQLEAIRRLRDAGALETLPEDLRETAALREQYEELTLNELRMKFLPPISKSGLSHRLSRIIAAAKSLGNDE